MRGGRALEVEPNVMQAILCAMKVNKEDIESLTIMKKGMTNHSYLMSCRGEKYIIRIPGEGTEKLINRREEASVYHVIADRKICDDIVYINAENGYKITKYYDDARVCDPFRQADVQMCMDKLREFHGWGLKVRHEFDLFEHIRFYESLWGGKASCYGDYQQVKKNIFSLRGYIDAHIGKKVLTHLDAVPDNFLFIGAFGEKEIRLIDWEYAAMQDPHVDIAMFAVYSMYDREQLEQLIHMYFRGTCPDEMRIKIYCYVAVCGLLWSNWCEYKKSLGVEFREYAIRQYQYAKEFFKIVQEELGREL